MGGFWAFSFFSVMLWLWGSGWLGEWRKI
jgi:hypothetical protein